MGSIADYVKEFTTLMLDIPDVPGDQVFFDFKDELKNWVKLELIWQRVKNLDEAIVAAKSLKDYSSQDKGNKPDFSKSGEEPQEDPNKGKENSHKKSPSGDPEHDKGPLNKPRPFSKLPNPCFICDGPHWVKDCPKKKRL